MTATVSSYSTTQRRVQYASWALVLIAGVSIFRFLPKHAGDEVAGPSPFQIDTSADWLKRVRQTGTLGPGPVTRKDIAVTLSWATRALDQANGLSGAVERITRAGGKSFVMFPAISAYGACFSTSGRLAALSKTSPESSPRHIACVMAGRQMFRLADEVKWTARVHQEGDGTRIKEQASYCDSLLVNVGKAYGIRPYEWRPTGYRALVRQDRGVNRGKRRLPAPLRAPSEGTPGRLNLTVSQIN